MKRILTICLLALTPMVFGQKKLTPELLWNLKRVGSLQISPDGKQILFAMTEYNLEANRGNTDLYIMPVGGGEATRLTKMDGSEFNALWHPSGEKVGFLSNVRGHGAQLYEVDLTGEKIQTVTEMGTALNGFKYSSDGEKILCIMDVKLDETINEVYEDLPNANVMLFEDLMYRHWNQWHDLHTVMFFTPNVKTTCLKASEMLWLESDLIHL